MITIHFIWLFFGACGLLLIGIIIGLLGANRSVVVEDLEELLNELNIVHCPRCGKPLGVHTDDHGSDLKCYNPECGYYSHIEASGLRHKIKDPEIVKKLKKEGLP